MYLVFENVIIRIEIIVVFRDFMTLVNRNKFCDYLTKPIITQIIVSLGLENVIIRVRKCYYKD